VTSELLIEAIVRQTTVLIAQLATSGGARTPLADVAEQVFLELVRELDRQGVSRKVAADMFGMALRTFRRRMQRLSASRTLSNRSLWEAVYSYVTDHDVVAHTEVMRAFDRDEEELVRGVLHDLVESGLVFRSGKGTSATFRSARPKERDHRDEQGQRDSTDALLAAMVYRFGPLTQEALSARVTLDTTLLESSLGRLLGSGQIVRLDNPEGSALAAPALVHPVGKEAGWEAAVFDHYHALVATVLARLDAGAQTPGRADVVGGSTYTLEVWPGHPLEGEAIGQLTELRTRFSDLRARIAAFNRTAQMPAEPTRVVVYFGQNVIENGEKEAEE
jgi:hypothetical protein